MSMFELQNKLNGRRIILGSASPRRRQLLEQMDLKFVVDTSFSGREDYPQGLKAEQVAEYLAKQKSFNFSKQLSSDQILITADTVVICESTIMGKPKNEQDAFEMLSTLSGKTHKVITGVCIRDDTDYLLLSDCSMVEFYSRSPCDIKYYVETYNPCDKAGAYGIQEWIGAVAIKKIEGSFFNIMGLPTEKLYYKLLDFLDSSEH